MIDEVVLYWLIGQAKKAHSRSISPLNGNPENFFCRFTIRQIVGLIPKKSNSVALLNKFNTLLTLTGATMRLFQDAVWFIQDS